MPFQSIPSFQINPQRAKLAKFLQSSAVSGTYYTVLDAIGRGKISAILIYLGETYSQTDHINLKITVDGKQEVVNPLNYITSYLGNDFYQPGETYQYQFSAKFDYIVELNFVSTVKVEVMQNIGSSYIACSVQYGLE